MGVFNTITVPCPCGWSVSFQSKVDGGCLDYSLDDAPLPVLADIAGGSRECQDCGRVVTVRVLYTGVADWGGRQ